MGRGLWFAAGVGTAIYGTVKARRLAYRLSTSGLSDQLATLRLGAQAFVADVRSGTRDREAELAEELGIAPRADDPDHEVDASAQIVTLTPRAVRKDPS